MVNTGLKPVVFPTLKKKQLYALKYYIFVEVLHFKCELHQNWEDLEGKLLCKTWEVKNVFVANK